MHNEPDKHDDVFFPGIGADYSYEKLLYAQVWKCLRYGSYDDSYCGKVTVIDGSGNYHEVIRDDNKKGFMNAVRMLYILCKDKMKSEIKKKISFKDYDLERAWANFELMMGYAHSDGIFGRQSIAFVLDWRQVK